MKSIVDRFPGLASTHWSVTSPATKAYNCIAWAAGDSEYIWWPDPMKLRFWPRGVPRRETVQAFVEAFESLGYDGCEDGSVEAGFTKVAIYALNGRPTHAARQVSGAWTSKLGNDVDIRHEASALEGDCYGEIVAYLRRPE